MSYGLYPTKYIHQEDGYVQCDLTAEELDIRLQFADNAEEIMREINCKLNELNKLFGALSELPRGVQNEKPPH